MVARIAGLWDSLGWRCSGGGYEGGVRSQAQVNVSSKIRASRSKYYESTRITEICGGICESYSLVTIPQTSRFTFWIILAEVIAVFSMMVVYIWEIRQFQVGLTIFILGLALASNALRGEGCRHVGFSWNNFARGVRSLGPAVLGIALLLLIGGALEHTFRNVTLRTAVAGFLIYCVWGLFQQYLLNGFLLNRLVEMAGGITSHWLLLPVAAVFSLIHAPNWFLMAVTLPAGYLSGLVYLRFRNLFVLALAHAMLGCLLYLVIPDSISHSLYVGPNYLSYGAHGPK